MWCGMERLCEKDEIPFRRPSKISRTEPFAEILATVGQPPREVLQRAEAPENKQRLREQNQWAVVHGIFGAPTMIVGKELFWGNDRLEDAIAFYLRGGELMRRPDAG